MIRLFKRLYFHMVRTRLAGPEKAHRPILILVEDSDD